MTNKILHKVATGISDFRDLVTNHDVFVDKTDFITNILDSTEQALLITCPRRWGKTMNLDMLARFLAIESDEKGNKKSVNTNRILFEGGNITLATENKQLPALRIAQEEDKAQYFYHQGRYPLIRMDFKDMEYEDQKTIAKAIISQLIANYEHNGLNVLDESTELKSFTIEKRINKQAQEIAREIIEVDAELREVSAELKETIVEIKGVNKKIGKQAETIEQLANTNTKTVVKDEQVSLEKKQAILKEQRNLLNDDKVSLEKHQASLERQQASLERQQASLERQKTLLKEELSLVEKEFNEDPKKYIQDMVKALSKALYNKYNEKVYILVDECDKPVNNFFAKGLEYNVNVRSDIIELLSGFFSAAGKGNDYLQKIILIGIFDTIKKGISGFNNVYVHGITSVKFTKNFGFSEEEVNEMIDKLEFNNPASIKEATKAWYNGYNVPLNTESTIAIYSPFAVTSHLNKCIRDEKAKPENYWSESGIATIIRNLLDTRFLNTSSALVQKISNITLTNEENFESMAKTSLADIRPFMYQDNEKVILYMLINSGYVSTREEDGTTYLRIPNAEVQEEYAKVIKDKIKLEQNSYNFIDLLGTWHAKLTYNPKTINVINAIKANDIKSLQTILQSEHRLQCDNKNLKLNFFHIAAISGNGEIFNELRNHCKDKTLLSAKDAIGKLTPIDYATLAGNTEIETMLRQDGYNVTELVQPSMFSPLLCHQYSPVTLSLSIFSAAFLKTILKIDEILPNRINNIIKLFDQRVPKQVLGFAALVGAIGIGIKYGISQLEENACKTYQDYHSIANNTLLGYKKFIDNNAGHHIILANDCKEEEKVDSLDVSYLQNDNNEILTFTLCKDHKPELLGGSTTPETEL